MPRKLFLFLFFTLSGLNAKSQVAHLVKAHHIQFTNKQISLASYELVVRRMCFSISGGIGNGTDNQFLSADDVMNGNDLQKIKASQTVYPEPFPMNTYLESCVSTYKSRQLRIGFTEFVRRNDTLGRAPATGLHFGVDAIYSKIAESQTVIYKSETDESRFTYSGAHNFNTLGAGSHIGWQFAFFKEHLYVDLRAAIVFYYPFMEEPNLNSPFAGNRWEFQGSIGWHFYRKKSNEVKDAGKEQIREKI